MPHTETKLESKEIFDGHVIHVTLDTVRLEDGRTSLREVVHHHGGACVLPIDDEGCIYLVRQFRYALGEEIWELPAGKLEPGEDPFESAKRELSEECGLSADNYIDLGVVYPTVGYDSEKIYLWAARAVSTWMPGNSWMWCACPLRKPCKRCCMARSRTARPRSA